MRKEIRKAEEAHALKMEEKKKQMEVKDLTHTKRLGKCKFREDGVNYKISEELTGTLREMKVFVFTIQWLTHCIIDTNIVNSFTFINREVKQTLLGDARRFTAS